MDAWINLIWLVISGSGTRLQWTRSVMVVIGTPLKIIIIIIASIAINELHTVHCNHSRRDVRFFFCNYYKQIYCTLQPSRLQGVKSKSRIFTTAIAVKVSEYILGTQYCIMHVHMVESQLFITLIGLQALHGINLDASKCVNNRFYCTTDNFYSFEATTIQISTPLLYRFNENVWWFHHNRGHCLQWSIHRLAITLVIVHYYSVIVYIIPVTWSQCAIA